MNNYKKQFTNTEHKVRLDKFLSENIENVSRAQIKKLILEGLVTVNDEINTSVHNFLKVDDVVTIDLESVLVHDKGNVKSIKYKVICDHEDFLVVNKPAGVLVHQFDKKSEVSLIDAVKNDYPEIEGVGEDPIRPGIVHRLDRDVSGLMVIAKNQKTFEYLKKQFQNRDVKKEYLALVHGKPEKDFDNIDFRIGRSAKKYKMAAFPSNSEDGKEAFSSYEVVYRYKKFTLLKVKIKTGRTHQIRVHLNAIKHPVIGDTIYSQKKFTNPIGVNRIFLHSYKLGFTHHTGEKFEFKQFLPVRIKDFINKAEENSHKLVMVCGPGGVGKTTIIAELLKEKSDELTIGRTFTTRKQREGVAEDQSKVSITEDEFRNLQKRDEFLEWAEFNKNLYGTHKKSVLDDLQEKHVVLNIDVVGMQQVMEKIPHAYHCFLSVKDLNTLVNRFKNRGESDDYIESRMTIAKEEMMFAYLFDEVFFNEDNALEEAKNRVEKFIFS